VAEKIEVKVSHRFTASAERVYDAWFDPDKVQVWLQTAGQSMGLAGDIRQVEIDASVGGAFLFSDTRDGVETKHWGTYLELDRPHRIVFTWILDEAEESDPGRVSLSPGDGATHHRSPAKVPDDGRRDASQRYGC